MSNSILDRKSLHSSDMSVRLGARKGIYNIWQSIKQRCLNKNNPKYHRYGGRGIKVCDEWLLIDGFSRWAEEAGFVEGMTIDRIDNDGDYCPKNCRFIGVSENSRKKRTTKITMEQADEIRKRTLSGESEYDLAKEFGVVHGTIWFINKGYTHVPDGECTRMLKERKKKNGNNNTNA